MRRPSWSAAAFFLALATAGVTARSMRQPRTLRVCADPNNMPFSNAKGEGLENALARLVSRALGAKLEYAWLPQRRGFVRSTLQAGLCDVMMEAPIGYDRAATTEPYYRSTYVFVFRDDRHLALSSLDDAALRHLHIGVQIIGDDYANTPPVAALGRRGLAANVVGYPVYGDYSTDCPQSPIIDAVVRSELDVAIVWGPLAGWYAKHAAVKLNVVPIAPPAKTNDEPDDTRFAFDIGMGVRRDDDRLRRELDVFIVTHRREVNQVLRQFGVPTVDVDSSRK